MSDVFTKSKRSQVMSRIRGARNKDTELRLIALFRAQRITGWRRQTPLVGKPDEEGFFAVGLAGARLLARL